MRHTRWLALLLAGVGPLAAASPAGAQPQKKTYVHFQSEADLARILTDKLQQKRGQLDLQNALKNFKPPPGLDLKQLADPQTLKQFRDYFEKNREKFKDIDPKMIEGALKGAAPRPEPDKAPDPKRAHEPPGPPQGNVQQEALPAAPPPAAEAEAPESGIQGQLAEWAQQLAEKLEHTRFGEELRSSEKWQAILRDLAGSLSESGAGKFGLPGGGLGKLGEGLRWPDWGQALPDLSRLKLPTLSLPSLPRPHLNVRLPRLNLGGPALGGGPPSVGGAGLAAGQTLLWGVLAVLVAVVLWRLAARGALARRAEPAGWQLGPWPVDPAGIWTRADLVRAFEYLALLRLGREARAWNHREIAGQLGGADAARGRAAGELASLYEQARYAPDDEPLAPADLDTARRNLCLLAGVATA